MNRWPRFQFGNKVMQKHNSKVIVGEYPITIEKLS